MPPEELAAAEAAAQRMTDLSGIPRTEAGPCNVEWVFDPTPGHTFSDLHGSARAIVYAKIEIHGGRSQADLLHEAGHALGFGHSPRLEDLMNAGPRVSDFSPDEVAILAWMYGR